MIVAGFQSNWKQNMNYIEPVNPLVFKRLQEYIYIYIYISGLSLIAAALKNK